LGASPTGSRHAINILEGLGASDCLEVGRCIVIAQEWPPGFVPGEVDGLMIEPWTYPAPALWAGPEPRRVEPAP
jgi:hypothetical protein